MIRQQLIQSNMTEKEFEARKTNLHLEKKKGVATFLKFCTTNYPNWSGELVQLSEDDLKMINIKKTLLKQHKNYHPDRKNQDKEGLYDEYQIELRQEITMIINHFGNHFSSK